MYRRLIPTFSLILLAVFLFNTCVYGLVLSGVLYFHQQAEKNALLKPTKKIVELRISSALVETRNQKFMWEKEWEFEYLGEMYDVVDSRKEGDTWIFECKHDTKEEILKNRIARESKRNQDNRDSQSKKNLKVGSDYFSELINIDLSPFFSYTVSYVPAESNYHSPRGIPDPPPDDLVI